MQSQASVRPQPADDFSFMVQTKQVDVSFMPKLSGDASSESATKERLSIFSTSSGFSRKKQLFSSEELEMQAIQRKRDLKAKEKRKVAEYFNKTKLSQ
jgi:hypothetical protein